MSRKESGPTRANDGLTPFQRFTDLTRRILAVPKSEIEERKKKERESEARRKGS